MILSNVLFKIKIIVEWNIHVKKKKSLNIILYCYSRNIPCPRNRDRIK